MGELLVVADHNPAFLSSSSSEIVLIRTVSGTPEWEVLGARYVLVIRDTFSHSPITMVRWLSRDIACISLGGCQLGMMSLMVMLGSVRRGVIRDVVIAGRVYKCANC